MTAAATDKFQKVGVATATTLDAPGYTTGGSAITVVSTTDWPTTTGITFAMDVIDANGAQVAGSYNEYVGVVASATSITAVSHANGTDQNYSAGTTTRVYIPVSAERENRLVDGLTAHVFNQDGTVQSGLALPSPIITTPKVITSINDTNGNKLISVSPTASAVNQLNVTNAATGTGPTLSAVGSDTNIDINLTPKGTGRVVSNGAGIPATATVAASQTTTSTSYADLATVGPSVTVTIGASGIALVSVGADQSNPGQYHLSGFVVSGANTIAASDATALIGSTGVEISATKTTLLTGLTPGSTTFKAQYRVLGGTGTFLNRNISVVPL